MTPRLFVQFLPLFCLLSFSMGSLSAQNGNLGRWDAWATLPVFDDGRIKPMNSFAQQVVKEICGTSRPFLHVNGAVVREQIKPAGISDEKTEEIYQRIFLLLSEKGRRVDANELLFSWLAEPEIWDFIPLFPLSQKSAAQAAKLGVNVSMENRVSVFQLQHSPFFVSQLKLLHEKPNASVDPVVLELFSAWSQFEALTFDPRHDVPDEMLRTLHGLFLTQGQDRALMPGLMEAVKSTWTMLAQYGLPATESAAKRDQLFATHPTSQRWMRMEERMLRLMNVYENVPRFWQRGTEPYFSAQSPSSWTANLEMLEQEFEHLLNEIDENFQESVVLLQHCYPEAALPEKADDAEMPLPQLFSVESLSEDGQNRHAREIRELVLTYHHAVKALRQEVKVAYLHLYDNGQENNGTSVRLLPLLTSQPQRDQNPWGTAAMLFQAGEPFMRRFFLNEYTQDDSVFSAEPVRKIFDLTLMDYRIGALDPTKSDFRGITTLFKTSLRAFAERVNAEREIATQDQAKSHEWQAYLEKTRYPKSGATLMEYRYFRWSPLVGMNVFAATSVIFSLFSVLASFFARKKIERALFWCGVAMLFLAVLVTLIGGVMRAWISGWAPVTNMFETILLMAFSVGLFGLWSVLSALATGKSDVLQRKPFLIVAAAIILATGITLFCNSEQFNSSIRPIMAVLRSNFWLTVHVFAIIIGYAAALIAWGISLTALGSVLFGRYPAGIVTDDRTKLPYFCTFLFPAAKRMMQIALVSLLFGTILGACWADYSWGRFWGWDPKEVWALITILFFAIILHLPFLNRNTLKMNTGGTIKKLALLSGGQLGSLAVLCTWYVVSFKFRSVHAYGGSADSNMISVFLWGFVVLNLLWLVAAWTRYFTHVYMTLKLSQSLQK